MLDKNHQQNQINSYSELSITLQENTFNSITYSEPFSKAIFLKQILPEIKIPIIFLDFDLLFSGYLTSQLISKPENLILFRPDKNNWQDSLKKIILKLLEKKSYLMIDSLNNFFSIFESNSNAGRLVSSYIMILTSIAKMSKSNICIFSMTRNDAENTVLSISGRRIPKITHMTHLYLNQTNSDLRITKLQKHDSSTFRYSIQSELV